MELKHLSIKVYKKILLSLLIIIVSIPFATILFLQHPDAQNWLAKQLLSAVKENINGEIYVDKVMVVFFNRVVVRDGYIVGNQNDTLVSFKELSISISSKNLLRGKLKANRVVISDGVFNYHEEGENNENNISRIFGSSDSEPTGINLPPADITELRVRNFRFNYTDPFAEKLHNDKECIDFFDLSLHDIDIQLNNVSYQNKVVSCKIEKIACIDKSGFRINSLKGNFSLGAKESRFENLILKDQYSTIRAKYLSFKYNSGQDLKTFTKSIRMSADFKNAILDFRTLGEITPELKKNTLAIDISGEVIGPVVNLSTNSLRIHSLSKGTKLEVAATIKGLPKIYKTIFDINILSLETLTPDLAEVIAAFNGTEPLKAISSIVPLTTLNYSCQANGRIDSLSLKGGLTSEMGGLEHDVHFLNKGKTEGVNLFGNITTQNLNLGSILGNDLLGQVSLETNLNSTIKGEKYDKFDFKINHLKIGRLGLNGYDYSNLTAVGEYSEHKFDGKIISHDPNLHFIFQGTFSLSQLNLNNVYNFYLDVPFADLTALNVDKRGFKSQLSLRTTANISTALNTKDLFGMVDIKNFSYTNDSDTYKIGNISLHSSFYKDLFKMNLDSPFMTASYESKNQPNLFISKLKNILLHQQFGDVFERTDTTHNDLDSTKYELNLRTFNTSAICEIISPGLYIADSTILKLTILEDNDLNFDLTSDRIAFNNNFLKDISIDLSNPDSLLVCNLISSQITAGGIFIENNDINITSEKGKIHLDLSFENEGDIRNDLSFSSDIFFNRDHYDRLYTNININKSNLYIQGYEWTFAPSSLIMSPSMYEFKNFKIYNEAQEIMANGKISSNPNDELNLNLNNFDLSIINSFLEDDLEIAGYFTGKASVMDLFDNPGIIMDLKGTNVSVFKNQIGELNLLSKWDRINKRINLLLVNKYLDEDPINISGYYQPNSKFLNINLALQDLSLMYLEPFLQGLLMDISGTITGDLVLFGRLDKLNLTTDNSRFNDFKFTPVFTKVPYTLNGPVEMDAREISLLNLSLIDKYNSVASINGTISHNFFKDIFLDAKLEFLNLECINTQERDNQQFYGTAFASGEVSITGSLDDLFLDVNVLTNEKTSIHIPLSSSASASTQEVLSFVKNDSTSTNQDPYDTFLSEIPVERIEESKIEIRGKATITPETEVSIEIDKQLGNILRCQGNGTIDFNINPSKDIMDIRGDYIVQEGNYNFVLSGGLISRDFILEEGGSISFNGDILSTNMNIGALYKTKASITSLIADTSAVGNRRNVDCEIKLLGTLNNPRINFTINIPDLDPITKGKVESALSTTDKVQRQFMALLLSGSFVPDEQSGIINNTTLFYSNASEIVSNQFNNIFRQLGIPLDLGLNYQPGEKGNEDMFDVALSYQAFNNRIIINGNVATGQSSNRGNVTGNLEAEWKIDKKGKLRIKGFTKSSDDISNSLSNTQRQGVGLTFQDEFNNFTEFWQSLFLSKKRKSEIETQKLLEAEAELRKESEEIESRKQTINKAKESPYMRHY